MTVSTVLVAPQRFDPPSTDVKEPEKPKDEKKPKPPKVKD